MNSVACTGPIALGGRYQSAVDGHAVEVRGNTAHADEAALALIALHRQPGDTLQGFGSIVIGQLTDTIGMHHALDAVGAFLLTQRLVDASRLADHLDPLDRIFCPGRSGGNGNGQQADPESGVADMTKRHCHL